MNFVPGVNLLVELCIRFIGIASPVLCLVGILLWRLKIRLSGVQLFGTGVLLGLGGISGWYLVRRRRANSQLSNAGSLIMQIHKENVEKFMNAPD